MQKALIAVVLVGSACSGGGSGGTDAATEVGDVVESGDGLASLALQPGSLPEGVSLDDVELAVLVNDT